MKWLIGILLLCIIGSLFRALYALCCNRRSRNNHTVVRALTWRIGLSVALFLLLLAAFFFGYITPNSTPY